MYKLIQWSILIFYSMLESDRDYTVTVLYYFKILISELYNCLPNEIYNCLPNKLYNCLHKCIHHTLLGSYYQYACVFMTFRTFLSLNHCGVKILSQYHLLLNLVFWEVYSFISLLYVYYSLSPLFCLIIREELFIYFPSVSALLQ